MHRSLLYLYMVHHKHANSRLVTRTDVQFMKMNCAFLIVVAVLRQAVHFEA